MIVILSWLALSVVFVLILIALAPLRNDFDESQLWDECQGQQPPTHRFSRRWQHDPETRPEKRTLPTMSKEQHRKQYPEAYPPFPD